MGGEAYLPYITVNPDSTSHIRIKNPQACRECEGLACLFICPSAVFAWDQERQALAVMYERCVECGACEPACPQNIIYQHPRGGYGVIYQT